MMTLTDFLLARIAEDEAVARAACIKWDYDGETRTVLDTGRRFDGHWHVEEWNAERVVGDGITIYDEGGHGEEQAVHIARHDPARVLAECEAKRRIVELHSEAQAAEGAAYEAARDYLECVLRALALPYADHPDYRPEWKP